MNTLFWYPPAETRIHLSSYLKALLLKGDRFEAELRAYLKARSCLLACSGRALLTLLLQALKQADAGGRDEVLIPAYTCYSVAASTARAGLKIAVYDLDPRTFRPDSASLENAAGSGTLAIIYQHLFGIPQPAGDFRETADRYGIPLVEDAAQGLGGFLHDAPLGAMGDFSIFSFGRGKPLALGSGGALSGKQETLAAIPALNGSHGFSKLLESAAMRAFSHPAVYGLMERLPLGLGATVFDPGFAISGMPEAMKRLAKSSFACLESFNSHRRNIAGVYRSRLDSARMVPEPEGSLSVYTRFPVFAGPKTVSRRLLRLGVRRMYPHTVIDEPAIKRYLAHPGSPAPGARQIAQELVTLPTHSRITPLIAHEIATALQEEYQW